MSHDAFLRTIIDRPDDDLPRLVYADWLDENGDPIRAEFIRVQCELAAMPDHGPRRPGLEDREHELLGAHEAEWAGFGDLSDHIPEWEFRRGFLHAITIGLWASSGDLYDRHPILKWSLVDDDMVHWRDAGYHVRGSGEHVRHLDCTGWPMMTWAYQPMLASPHWTALTSLDLAGLPGLSRLAETLGEIASIRRLTSLSFGGRSRLGSAWGSAADETLDIPALNHVLRDNALESLAAFDCGLSSDGLAALLAAPWAARMQTLDVSENPIRWDDGLAFRAAAPDLRLRRLDIAGTPLSAGGLAAILGAKACQAMTELDISGPASELASLNLLAGSKYWSRATAFRYRSAGATPSHIKQLCSVAGSPDLRVLDLGDNRLGSEGVFDICGAPWADGLVFLGLSGNRLNDYAAEAIAEYGPFPKLRTLHLADNIAHISNRGWFMISDRGAAALAASPSLANLRLLTLSRTGVTDASVETLLNAPHWRLSGLGLASCRLTTAAVPGLATSPRLARLNWLDLSGNRHLGGAALLPLAESPYLSRLCELDLGGIDVDPRVVEILRERLGPRLSL